MNLIKGNILLDYIYRKEYLIIEVMQSDSMRYKIVKLGGNTVYYLDKELFCETSRVKFSISLKSTRDNKLSILLS